ncbi:hypothetical protein JHD50_12845 [Sulfurimonas sp. MAG313]|nr:hypothetical protein [Sulfurimonas sp. MAG313]
MSKLDMSALQKMQTEAINTEKDVKEMCANGQRDKAQKVAISFAKRMLSMPIISQIQECTKLSSLGNLMKIEETDFTKTHVCDGKEVDLGIMPKQQRINW